MKGIAEELIVCLAVYVLASVTYRLFLKQRKKLHWKLAKSVIQGVCIACAVCILLSQISTFRHVGETVLMSSSLLAVVLGFACQRALEDLIAGLLISICRPFELGDRISVSELELSGRVEDITLRHTVIRTYNSSRMIVPNSRMSHAVIENAHYSDASSVGFLDASITYESDIKEAEKIMKKVIRENKRTVDDDPAFFVRSLDDSGVSIRGMVRTSSIDENFIACSEIRATLLSEFPKNGIEFAYPHVDVNWNRLSNIKNVQKK